MRILYGTSPAGGTRPAAKTVAPGGVGPSLAYSGAVSAVAVFDCDCTVTIEASGDGFATLAYSADLGAVSGSALHVLPAPVTAARWRLKSADGGRIGMLYVGTLATIKAPTYPWAFETNQTADDRTSLGGATFSRLLYARREGEWRFTAVNEVDVPTWRAWYDATRGFRLPFVVENPLSGAVYLAKAPGPFPLSLTNYKLYDGGMIAVEVPGV